MRGAEALLRTLVAGGVEVCFTNPGTSEMQFVAALDRVPGMRTVLTLFEGVATGAADGYARMLGRPAATLLHLGPGLANGLANLHNARRAGVPMVNIVGEHARDHLRYDAPLTSDIALYARQVSGWLRSAAGPETIAEDTAAAILASRQAPGQIATLITPADCTWEESPGPAAVPAPPPAPRVGEAAVLGAAQALRSGEPALILIGGGIIRAEALAVAGRIAARSGARLASGTFFARIERGAGRVAPERLPYGVRDAMAFLSGLRHLILVGAKPPVAFFAYPGLPSLLAPPEVQLHTLATLADNCDDALARLADLLGAREPAPVMQRAAPAPPQGQLTPQAIGAVVAGLLPEGAIVVDEAITGGFPAWQQTAGAAPHDWLVLTGGAIGDGLPMATGAAMACPDRRVISLQADGSAAYTLQALWTQAREQLNITTILYANHTYRILEHEYRQTSAGSAPGPQASQVMQIGRPNIDWVSLARGLGVPAVRVERAEDLSAALARRLHEDGPGLIEAAI